jgi:hypothetical protein
MSPPRERRMVEPAKPQSYYGQPVIKRPEWKPLIPLYFFSGGVAGASAALALAAEAQGNPELARRAWVNALAGVGVSQLLLIGDLGRPARFLNMFRVFKVTSPMSVGSWLLGACGGATTLAAVNATTGAFPVGGRAAKVAAGALGLPLCTYTAALIANTSVPVWHEARWTLPFVFAAGAAASAGGAAAIATPAGFAAPARRLAVGGAVAEAVSAELMRRRLGELGEPYSTGGAGHFRRAGALALAAGAALLSVAGGRSRPAAIAGGSLVMAGALLARQSVFRAGVQSAADPKYTVGPQRARIERGDARGAVR